MGGTSGVGQVHPYLVGPARNRRAQHKARAVRPLGEVPEERGGAFRASPPPSRPGRPGGRGRGGGGGGLLELARLLWPQGPRRLGIVVPQHRSLDEQLRLGQAPTHPRAVQLPHGAPLEGPPETIGRHRAARKHNDAGDGLVQAVQGEELPKIRARLRKHPQERLHRHEPPVVGGPIAVLGDSGGAGGLVAVTKPASMPVHASGQHRHNTLLGVLAETRPDLGELFPLHRLDKPVSGVVVLARSSVAADGFRRALEGGAVRELYLARVCGRLPETELLVEAPVLWDDDAKASRALGPQEAGEFEKAAAAAPPPAASWAPRPGRGRGCPKSAATYFRHLAEGPDGTSLVLCAPITGRTHQIRVHLAYSGCPIANDEKYGGSAPPASPLGTPEEVEREVRRVHGPVQGVWDHCPHCPHWMPSYSDLAAVAAPLFLHAHRYTGPGWEFESPPPGWAAELLGGAPVPHVELPGGGRKNAGNACVT